jgi:uncharacterized protein YndB with AHSA1/START domain
MSERTDASGTERRTIRLTHLYDAPPERVFRAWIEPAQLRHWFHAADGWTTPFAESDPHPGGAFRIGFGSPDGKNDFVFGCTYCDVAPPARLAFTIGDGRPVTVEIDAEDEKPRLVLSLALENVFSEEQQRQGWSAMLTNFGTHLNGRAA